MGLSEILASIDREIARLQTARTLLTGVSVPVAKRKVGRPRKAVAAVSSETAKPEKKRNLSPEGRRRIAEAVKRRWVAQRKTAAASAK